MTHTSYIDVAYGIAKEAHEGQVDKAGEPYISHPLAVARIVRSQGYGEAYEAAAVLHDVLEDSGWTAHMLLCHGIPVDVVVAVEALTHRKRETRAAYRQRIKENEIARVVKLADIAHNTEPERLERLEPADAARLSRKYQADLEDLTW